MKVYNITNQTRRVKNIATSTLEEKKKKKFLEAKTKNQIEKYYPCICSHNTSRSRANQIERREKIEAAW